MAEEGRDEKGRFTNDNLFQRFVKNWNGGRPPFFEKPEDLAQKIAEYLDYEDSLKRPDTYSKQGKGIYTLSGCALYLGFSSRDALQEYEKKDPLFSDIIKAFRLFMTHWNEQKIYWGGTFNGSSFWLKNWGGYKDESTQNQIQTVTQVNPTVISSGVPLANKEDEIQE